MVVPKLLQPVMESMVVGGAPVCRNRVPLSVVSQLTGGLAHGCNYSSGVIVGAALLGNGLVEW